MSVEASLAPTARLVLSRPLPRPRLLMAGLLIVVIGLCIPIGVAVIEKHDERLTRQMLVTATRIPIPAGLTTLSRGQCPSQTGLVECWTAPQAPDELVGTFATAMKEATGGKAQARCETMIPGSRNRSCVIRYGRAGHWVSVSIDTNVRRVGGKIVADGSRIRLDAM